MTSTVNTVPPLIRTLAEIKIKWFDLKEGKKAALQHTKKDLSGTGCPSTRT